MAFYLVSTSYDEDDHEVDVEVYLEGPDDLTAEEVEQVFRDLLSTGEVPEGWSFEAINWRDHEGELDDLERFRALFNATEVDIEPLEGPGEGEAPEEPEE